MKKTTFLSAFLLLLAWGSYGQCIRTAMWPSSPVVSNNQGLPQTLNANPYSSEYSQISTLIVGKDYIFTASAGGADKYITVTETQNAVIAQGVSPLTVEAITANEVRLHFSDDAECASTPFVGLTVTIQALLDCPPPVGLTALGITTTSAILEWEPLGSETAWQVLVLENGLPAPTPSTMGTDVSGGEPTYTASLSPATTYRFFVRANCGEEFSPWNGPFAFVSACEAVAEFSENFDTYDYAANPTCWKQIKN